MCRRTLFQGWSRGIGLRRRWGGRCPGRRHRGICGALDDMAILCQLYASKLHFPSQGERRTYPKASTIRNSNRQIRKHGERTIQLRLPERKIVANLMDCQEQILVRRSANHVRRAPEPP